MKAMTKQELAIRAGVSSGCKQTDHEQMDKTISGTVIRHGS